MDEIRLTEMVFYGRHGVFPEEQRLGQRFVVNVTLRLNLQPAGERDDLTLSVDYGAVYETVRTVVEGPPRQLLEAVAEEVSQSIFAAFPTVQEVAVEVQKPSAPIPGVLLHASVRTERKRGQAG
ncbi:MAG: dihydroneopterin aldolase [Alicyclobacillus sp.]|nr:dihydroneopterin aldolase [Alicyclobacillus sp.]